MIYLSATCNSCFNVFRCSPSVEDHGCWALVACSQIKYLLLGLCPCTRSLVIEEVIVGSHDLSFGILAA